MITGVLRGAFVLVGLLIVAGHVDDVRRTLRELADARSLGYDGAALVGEGAVHLGVLRILSVAAVVALAWWAGARDATSSAAVEVALLAFLEAEFAYSALQSRRTRAALRRLNAERAAAVHDG